MLTFVSRFLAVACTATVLAIGSGEVARASTCNTNWCQLTLTPTIYVFNDEFGNQNGQYGSGSITVNSSTAWSASWNYPTPPLNWGVLEFPCAVLGWQNNTSQVGNSGLGFQLSTHTPANTSNTYTVTGNSTQDVSYDLWYFTTSNPALNATPACEVMIWQYVEGGLSPTTTPVATNVSLDGHTWNVYEQSPVLFLFWRQGSDILSANLNISDFSDWMVNHGYIAGSDYLCSIEFGSEIYANNTGNAQSGTLNVTNYTASVGTVSPPPAPTGLAATAGNAQVSLTWNASSGATSYSVYRGTSSGGESGTAIASGITGTSYTNTGLTNGTTYYYKVKAANSGGTSGYSNEASATPSGGSGNTHGGTWACKAVMTSTATWKNIWQAPTGTATNSTYTASLWLKGTGAVVVRINAGLWGTEITRQTFTATSSWQQHSFTFSTGSNTQITYDISDGGGVAGTAYIDDCFMGVSGGSNKLANPGFESGNTTWTIDSGAPFSIVQNP